MKVLTKALDGIVCISRVGQNIGIGLHPNNDVGPSLELMVSRGNISRVIAALVLKCKEMGIEPFDLGLIVGEECQNIMRESGEEDSFIVRKK